MLVPYYEYDVHNFQNIFVNLNLFIDISIFGFF